MLDNPSAIVAGVHAGDLPDDDDIVKLVGKVLLLCDRKDFVEEFLWQACLTTEEMQEVADIEQWVTPARQLNVFR